MSKFSDNPFVVPSVLVAAAISGSPGLYPPMAFLYHPLLPDEVEIELGKKADGKAFMDQMRAVLKSRVSVWAWSETMDFVELTDAYLSQLKHGALRDIYLVVIGLSPSAAVPSHWKWPGGTDLAGVDTQQGKS